MDLGEEVSSGVENAKEGHANGYQKDDEGNITVRKGAVELLKQIYTVRMS